MNTPSIARLQTRLEDARRLIKIHEECTGNEPGRRHGYDTLNKSVIVLTVAAWEDFIEDLAKYAAIQISTRAKGPSTLPSNVRDAMLAHLYLTAGWSLPTQKTKDAVWALSGRGWRREYLAYVRVRVESFHTPNYANAKKLYSSLIGLSDLTQTWGASRWRPEDYRRKLDDLLKLRHRIAHGIIGNETVGKTKAKQAIAIVERVSGWTEKAVLDHLRSLEFSPLRRVRLTRTSQPLGRT
jgi:hypothetical protein